MAFEGIVKVKPVFRVIGWVESAKRLGLVVVWSEVIMLQNHHLTVVRT